MGDELVVFLENAIFYWVSRAKNNSFISLNHLGN